MITEFARGFHTLCFVLYRLLLSALFCALLSTLFRMLCFALHHRFCCALFGPLCFAVHRLLFSRAWRATFLGCILASLLHCLYFSPQVQTWLVVVCQPCTRVARVAKEQAHTALVAQDKARYLILSQFGDVLEAPIPVLRGGALHGSAIEESRALVSPPLVVPIAAQKRRVIFPLNLFRRHQVRKVP